MGKTIARSIEIHCEEHEKSAVTARIINYLGGKKDWINGNIAVIDDQFETIEVVFFDGCQDAEEAMAVMEVLSI